MDAKTTSNEVQRRILDAVDDAFDRQIETTKQFSAIPSTRGAEGPCQDMMHDLLRTRGFEVDDWHINVDDLKGLCQETLQKRLKHVAAAEAIIAQEQRRFLNEFVRRRNAPIIAQLTKDFETKRQAVVSQLLNRINGRLTDADRADIEGAFRLLQNQILHGPISALAEAAHEGSGHNLLDALRKLFRLRD